MTSEEITHITAMRCSEWGNTLIEAHATPMLMIGVGHDHVSGELHVCVPDGGPSGREMALLLRRVADWLEKGG